MQIVGENFSEDGRVVINRFGQVLKDEDHNIGNVDDDQDYDSYRINKGIWTFAALIFTYSHISATSIFLTIIAQNASIPFITFHWMFIQWNKSS